MPIPKQSNVKCLNDYRPVALTSIPAKCLERLIIKHIKKDHFANRENRSSKDAIAIVLHTLSEHLELKNTYARMLFVDFSSAFNTIRPYKLWSKLQNLGLNTKQCNWMVYFLINHTQCVRIGGHTSSTFFINTGVPQGCMFSPLLYTIFYTWLLCRFPIKSYCQICRWHHGAWAH